MTMAFEYLEIRPCIEDHDGIESFIDEAEYEEAFLSAAKRLAVGGIPFRAFWTLYGRYADEAGQLLAMAIGDFTFKEDAFAVMNAILAPMAKARDIIDAGSPETAISPSRDRLRGASAVLDDFINQSSNHERL